MRSPVGTEVSPPGLRGGWDAVWKQDRRTSHSPTRPEGALPTKRTGEKHSLIQHTEHQVDTGDTWPCPPSSGTQSSPTRQIGPTHQRNACSPATASMKPSLITDSKCLSPFLRCSVLLPGCPAPCTQREAQTLSASTRDLEIQILNSKQLLCGKTCSVQNGGKSIYWGRHPNQSLPPKVLTAWNTGL